MSRALCVSAILLTLPALAAAQAPVQPVQAPPLPLVTICGQQTRPLAEPPTGSGPVVLNIAPCFEAQGNTSLVEPQTYLYYIQVKPSTPSQGNWVPYTDTTEKTINDDFHRLWATGFLDNLWIDVKDYTFPNGVIGKIVLYNMEERQRVKIVDYLGSKKIETSKIDERLKDANANIRLDTFIDPSLVRKVQGIVTDMLKEKGLQYATVTPEIKDIGGGPKLVHLTFHMDEGPTVKIRKIEFTGNKALGAGALKKQMKDNKELWFLSFLGGRGTYQETKFDDDAEKVVAHYHDLGYIRANVGVPEVTVLGDSKDKKVRFVQLKVPIIEGARYKIGTVDVAGNTVVKSEFLKPLFKLTSGEYYSEKNVRKGLDKAREIYGGGGYWEFTGYPDLKPRDDPNTATAPEAPDALRPAADKAPAGPPIVDVTMRMVEGTQYFVNRIVFVGNTTTHDNVIRRELRLVEDGVFNTEALKYSVKRLNQLGYFKPLEGGSKDVDVQKVPGETNKVDVRLTLTEQNRNQLTFGAGVSEFEGFFGQASFQTSNFLGRGENLTLSLSAGSRAQNYSLAFTEPFLFDRNITGGFNLFRNDVRYVGQFTQRTAGGVLTFGYPLGGFTRMFTNYSYQRVRVTEISANYTDPAVLARNPFLADSLLIGAGGERIISKVTPSIVHNTVDQPIFPSQGVRYTASIDLAGLGGNTNYYKPTLEGVWFWHQNSRMSLGTRANFEYIHAYAGSESLPIFEKLFLGGEYTIRGFDIRSIGPHDAATGLVLGGNKSLLFNLEENFNIVSQVRVIAFFDAGQVRDAGQPFAWKETLTQTVVDPAPVTILSDPFSAGVISLFGPTHLTSSQEYAFKASTGLELRFFMPVLNVPFRLIMAYNPSRAGVLDNTLQPQSKFQFRFAVGTTF